MEMTYSSTIICVLLMYSDRYSTCDIHKSVVLRFEQSTANALGQGTSAYLRIARLGVVVVVVVVLIEIRFTA